MARKGTTRRDNGQFKRGAGGRPPGIPNKATKEIKAIARKLLEDPDYQAALKYRLRTGEAGAVEVALYHYAYGKPKDTVLIEDQWPYRDLTDAQLEAKIAELDAAAGAGGNPAASR